MKMLKVLDLFCGSGGLSYGFSKVGFEVAYGLDNWKPAVETFSKNHPKSKCVKVDITKVSDEKLRKWFLDVDVIVGGPPCQGFSTSGKRALDDPRNRLVREFLRAIKALKPKAFVMENVEGFVNFNKGKLVFELIDEFEKCGYQLSYGVLDSVNFGIPQKRKRFFVIGIEGTKPSLPTPTHSSSVKNCTLPGSELKRPYIFWDAVSDLPLVGSGEKAEEYASPPQNDYQKELRKKARRLTLHEAPNHRPQMVELIKYIPQGKSAFEVMDDIPPHLRPTSGYPNSYKRIKLDEPSPTVTRNFTTPSSANCIHPLVHRALTLREGARIQSFPDDYEFVGSFTDKRLLIGNAVPPLLSLAIAKELANKIGMNKS